MQNSVSELKKSSMKEGVQHCWTARATLVLAELHLEQYMDSSNMWAAYEMLTYQGQNYC